MGLMDDLGHLCESPSACLLFGPCLGVAHIPIIKYIFEIHLSIICIAGGKNGKENMEGLKTVQLSAVVVTLLYRYLA